MNIVVSVAKCGQILRCNFRGVIKHLLTYFVVNNMNIAEEAMLNIANATEIKQPINQAITQGFINAELLIFFDIAAEGDKLLHFFAL